MVYYNDNKRHPAMKVDSSFYKSIYEEDIIYHYTKAPTAIDFILSNNQIRFNSSRKSMDPIESRKARRSINHTGANADEKEKQDLNELEEYLFNLENQFLQICFCKNDFSNPSAIEDFVCFNGNEELFGFTKPRMWDQYADNYSGVCLAFSKKKIISKNNGKFELFPKDIDYKSYCDLKNAKIESINLAYLKEVGKEQYKKQIKEKITQSFFIKQKDYSGESEFRIGTFYDKKKCTPEYIRGELVIDNSMMLDISNCIKAIFVSSYANENQKRRLLNSAKKLDIPIIEMVWQYSAFEARDYRERFELNSKLKNIITTIHRNRVK